MRGRSRGNLLTSHGLTNTFLPAGYEVMRDFLKMGVHVDRIIIMQGG